MAPLTVTVKSVAATLQSNTLGRKFQDPTKTDSPVFLKHFYYKNETGGTLADGTIIDFGPILGPGIIEEISAVNYTAMGASRVLNLGLQEYRKQKDNALVSADINTLVEALDVSSAGNKSFRETTSDTVASGANGLEIHGVVNMLGQITGGTIPANGIVSGVLVISKPL